MAEEIRALMGRKEINKTELARRLGVSDMWVQRRLRGGLPIDLNDLQRIADVLGVGVLDLLPKRPTAEWLTGERVIATVGAERPTRHQPIIPRPVAGPPTRPVTQTRPTSRPENRPSLTVAV